MKLSWNEPSLQTETNGVKTTENVSHVSDDANESMISAILDQYQNNDITISIKIK